MNAEEKEVRARFWRRYPASAGLLPHQIQRRECRFNPQCYRMETGTQQTDDGNRVELNWNDGRLNVNNNWDDNRNDNLWSSSVRHFLRSSFISQIPLGGGLPFSAAVLIHPPSILPISSTICWMCTDFFKSRIFVSRANRRNIRSRLSRMLACSNMENFFSLPVCPLRRSDSISSRDVCSIFCQRVCRSFLGMPFLKLHRNLYSSYAFVKMGISKVSMPHEIVRFYLRRDDIAREPFQSMGRI